MDPTETTVVAVREVGTDAVAIEVATPEGFSARPGQFVKLSATVDGESVSRFYTVSSIDTDGTFELTISYDPDEGGAFSEYLLSIAPDDPVTIAGPFGSDYYEGEPRVVVLAGGPGVGPAVAIAEGAIADGGEAVVIYRDDDPDPTRTDSRSSRPAARPCSCSRSRPTSRTPSPTPSPSPTANRCSSTGSPASSRTPMRPSRPPEGTRRRRNPRTSAEPLINPSRIIGAHPRILYKYQFRCRYGLKPF